MKIQETLDYIKAYMELGYTKKQIVDILVKKGVTLGEIELCFKSLGVYSVEDLASTDYLYNNLLISLLEKGWKDVTGSMITLHTITKWDFICTTKKGNFEWFLIIKRTGDLDDKGVNNIAIAFSQISSKLSHPKVGFLLFFISDSVYYTASKKFLALKNEINYFDLVHGIARTYLIDMTSRKCLGKEFVFPITQSSFASKQKHLIESELRLDIDLFERESYARKRKSLRAVFIVCLMVILLAIGLFLLELYFV